MTANIMIVSEITRMKTLKQEKQEDHIPQKQKKKSVKIRNAMMNINESHDSKNNIYLYVTLREEKQLCQFF